MEFDPSRLRRGELIVGAGAIVLLASMFLLDWYGLNATLAPTAARLGVPTSVTGWDGLSHLRWLMVVTCAVGLALVYFQAARRAPAVPVSLSVIVTTLGILTTLALIYRVLINKPGQDSVIGTKAGAWVGLASAIAIAYGGYLSLRQEGVPEKDGPGEIPTVNVEGLGGS